MSKAVLVLLVVGLFFLLTAPTVGSPFSVITGDSWVFDAVEELASGELASLPGISSLDLASVTRYEISVWLAGIIRFLESPEEQITQRFGLSRDVSLVELIRNFNGTTPTAITERQAYLLFQLAMEFAPELEIMGYRISEDPQHALGEAFLPHGKDDAAENGISDLAEASESEELTQPSLLASRLWAQYLAAESLQYPDDKTDVALESMFGLAEAIEVFDEQFVTLGDLVLGARYAWLEESLGDELGRSALAGLAGRFTLSNDIVLEGRYLHSTDTVSLGAGEVQLGASVKMGDVEVGGMYRALQAGRHFFDDLDAVGGGTGYGISFKLGDFLLSTVRSHLLSVDRSDEQFTATSIDLRYGFPNSVSLTAGYRVLDSEVPSDTDFVIPARATLGVDIPMTQGRLIIDLTSEWTGEERTYNAAPVSGEETGARKTAAVGLSYLLNNDASVRLNYTVIDFSNMGIDLGEQKSNVATAEFSIRF